MWSGAPEQRRASVGLAWALMLQMKNPGAGPGWMEVRMREPDKRQAGAQKDEITLKMKSAGAAAWIAWDDSEYGTAHDLAEAVYLAMRACSRDGPRRSS